MLYAGSRGSRIVRSAEPGETSQLALASAGSTTAFQPLGSSCAERTPRASASRSGGSPAATPATQPSASSRRSVSESAAVSRMSASSKPAGIGEPVSSMGLGSAMMRSGGEATTAARPEVSAAAGSVTVRTSGVRIE